MDNASTSTSKVTSPVSPDDSMKHILPSPEKKPMPKKRMVLSSSHLTSDKHFQTVKLKKSLFKNNNNNNNSINICENKTCLSSSATPHAGKPQQEHSNDNHCGFFHLDYNCEKSAKKGPWIQCQDCNTWYHEICVGGVGRRYFVCGKCV